METITLAEAATHLGISTKTARRWVKVGRLAATLHPGEHGPEYRVAVETLTAAQIVEPPDNVRRVATADQAAMLRALDSLPTLATELREARAEARETGAQIRAEIAELRQIVLALAAPATPDRATITEANYVPESPDDGTPLRRPWWRRWWRSSSPVDS